MFTLGTVQLGLPYGAANQHGLPSEADAIAIIQQAIDLGISSIDTARAYGAAEDRIGQALAKKALSHLSLITKMDPLTDLSTDASQQQVYQAVERSIALSCQALQQDHLQTLLLHRFDHFTAYQGWIWQRVCELKRAGTIQRLGVSVYSPQQAIAALQRKEIGHIQLPFNLLDHRWLQADVQQAIQARQDVIIHVRSVLLQGLLATRQARWPVIDEFIKQKIQFLLDRFVIEFGRKNWIDLCYAYARSFPWISSLVIGIETAVQLTDNIQLFSQEKLRASQIHAIQQAFAFAPESLLNPAQWKTI